MFEMSFLRSKKNHNNQTMKQLDNYNIGLNTQFLPILCKNWWVSY